MTDPQHAADLLFGSNLVAMVTPMQPDGSISEPGVANLVDHLLATGCDGIVVGGTTGGVAHPDRRRGNPAGPRRGGPFEAPGSGRRRYRHYDTAGSIRRAREAEAAGADALLLVCPYYSRPTQAGVVAHCVAVADATELPVMLYDVPARTGIAMEEPTLVELAGHPRIRAVKDAKGNLFEAMSVMGRRLWPTTAASMSSACPTSRPAPPAWSALWATLSPAATPSSSEPSAPATSTRRGRSRDR